MGEPSGWLTIALSVATALGVGTVLGAVYTARATEARERKAWLREKQIEAYDRFLGVLWTSYNRVAGGEARAARDRNDESTIDEIRAGHQSDLDALLAALPDVTAYGEGKLVKYANGLGAAWEQWMWEATPLAGAQTWPAVTQQRRAVDEAMKAIYAMSLLIRVSLGPSNRILRREVASIPLPRYRSDHPIALIPDPIIPRRVLNEWRVREFSGGAIPIPPSGYETAGTPWATLKVDHINYFQPLAAVAIKKAMGHWRLAIDARLPWSTIYLLELDAVRLITGNTGAWPTKYGSYSWVPGEEEGDKVYLWSIADLARQGVGVGLLHDLPEVAPARPDFPVFHAATAEDAAEFIATFLDDDAHNPTGGTDSPPTRSPGS